MKQDFLGYLAINTQHFPLRDTMVAAKINDFGKVQWNNVKDDCGMVADLLEAQLTVYARAY